MDLIKKISKILNDQEQALNKAIPIPKYNLLHNSCVTKVQELLAPYLSTEQQQLLEHPVLPHDLFRRIHSMKGRWGVMYPSQRSLRLIWQKQKLGFEKSADVAPYPLAIYPYGITDEPNYQQNLVAGIVNVPVAGFETLLNIVKLPWQKNSTPLQASVAKVALSALQLVGFTLLHPAPTAWTEAEIQEVKSYANLTPLALIFWQEQF